MLHTCIRVAHMKLELHALAAKPNNGTVDCDQVNDPELAKFSVRLFNRRCGVTSRN